MLRYLFKRLLYALPVLWFIVTLIFILSRLLPSSFASETLLSRAAEANLARSTTAAKQQAYQQYLIRTGQHLPLFYISVGSLAEPDTLYKIYPETERQHLKELVWHYGNWGMVSAYYNQVKLFENNLSPTQLADCRPALRILHTAVAEKAIQATLQQLQQLVPGNAALDSLQAKAESMIGSAAPATAFIPAVHWHGTENQYHHWLLNIFSGNAGTSYRSERPVQDILLEAIGNTWILMLASMILSTMLALELAILFIQRPFIWLKRILMPGLFALDSIPLFLLCLLLLVLFANPEFLQLFPVYGLGFYQGTDRPWVERAAVILPFMILPVICLTLAYLPYLTNQFYSALADAEQSDYIRTARAKGLPSAKVIRRHILRNALLPMITLLSDFIPALVAGAVVTETIFAIPGMGSLLVSSVQARDYPVIVAIVLIVAVFKVISHLVAEAFYRLADPRIHSEKT